MKRIISLLVTGWLLLLLAACGNASAPQNTQTSEESSTESSDTSSQRMNGEESSDHQESNILVAYFSCTGNTEAAAETAAELLSADLYEIVPEDPYTEEDLAYNSSTRASEEQQDPNARPAISDEVEDMSRYDTVLVGYPIWSGQAPRIINTFLESNDFSGKTVIPFCTSSSDGIEDSEEALHDLYEDSIQFGEGARFPAGAEQDEIRTWLSENDLL